jgi:hypothetical protein
MRIIKGLKMVEEENGSVEAPEEVAAVETEEQEQVDGLETEGSDETEAAEAEEETLVVGFEGDSPAPEEKEEAPEWVREVRATNRELKKKNRELEKKLNETTVESNPTELPAKPKLDDFDYDSEQYESALLDWSEKKREHEQILAKQQEEVENQNAAWNKTLENYGTAKNELANKAKDFDDAEEVVLSTLSETQQAMILQGSEAPATLVYALGKNPKKAAALASIKDPVKFAFAVARLETTLKVSNVKKPPAPEKQVKGSAASGGSDKHLEKLRAEANKTGDFSKLTAYKKEQKAK